MVSYSKDGNPELFLGAEIDITNIKETEKKLAAAKTNAEQLAREADTLIKIGAVITSSLKLEDTANLVLEQISAVIPYDVATVFILNESHLQVVGGVGYDDATTVIGRDIPYPEDGCINTLIIQFKKPILCNNISQEFPKFKHIYKKQKIKSLIGLPLISRGEVIGLLSISSFTSGFYTEKDYNLCSKFADNIAVAIVNAILHEKVYNMALSDSLTQINNRHGLKIHGDYLLEQAKRFQREFSTLILDIDHFKKVNDRYGHDIGDLVIKRIGKSLQEVFRSTDVLARYGGEEFVVLLPETDQEKALQIAERLRKKVELLDCKEMQNGITISIGVYMCIPKEGDYLENLIKKADEYMYKAKTNGRNCVVGC
jgi:diguanylate cyclase (GGDEF)-like protein